MMLILAVTILLAISRGGLVQSYAFSSNSNAFFGQPSTECIAVPDPATYISFTQAVYTNGVGNNQWSTQMNSYTNNNSPTTIDFMQYDMAVDGNGNVYGSVEYWTYQGGSVMNLHTGTIRALGTTGGINPNDVFEIELYSNSNNQITQVNFLYYESFDSTWYSGSITISQYLVPVLAWTLNIVGENGGEYRTFYTGAGNMVFDSQQYGITTTWQSSQTQGCYGHGYGVITQEGSNMDYGTPSIVSDYVEQTFVCTAYCS